MSGAILQPPTRSDADWGVLYIEVSGCLPMCGHGTIGVATVLVESGMVEVTEPITKVRLDTPAGLVVVDVAVSNGRAEHVTLQNVPAYSHALDATVDVPGLGKVTYDLAYGGNFYAILPLEQLGIPFDRAEKDRILAAGLDIMDAINATDRPVHPLDPGIHGCKHVQFTAPGLERQRTRATRWRSTRAGSTGRRVAPVRRPGWRNCTPAASSALNTDFVNESFIGTRFTGRLLEETTVGDRAGRRTHSHRPSLDHRHGQLPAGPGRPVPGRVRALVQVLLPVARDVPARDRLVGRVRLRRG